MCEETSPPQGSISDRYRSNVALLAIGIDRCSFSSTIIVGGMFHGYTEIILRAFLADLRIWKIFGHGEPVASLTLLDGFIACHTPPDSRSMLFAVQRYVRGAGKKRDVVRSEEAYAF